MTAEKTIAEALLKSRSKSDRDNRYIRGSSIGMCKRRIGYQLLGYQGLSESGHSLFILDLGNAIHDLVQRQLVNMGWIKAKPVLVDGNIDWEQTDDKESGCELSILDHDLRIIGHCDGVTVPLKINGSDLEDITPDPNGERYLIEIKSITDKPRFWVLGIRDGGTGPINELDCPAEFIDLSYEESSTGNMAQRLSRYQHTRLVRGKFNNREAPVYKLKIDGKDELVTVLMVGNSMGSFSSLKKPKPDHILQASLYANALNLKKILFIYVGKDIDSRGYKDLDDLLNIPVKVFKHEVDELDIELISSKVKGIYDFVDNKELPPRDYTLEEDRSGCKFCPYSWQCWPESIEIAELNERLSNAGLPPLKEGPGITHKFKKDLKKEYKNGSKAT